ncbi:MAG: relaxase domain-containing protein [Gaiellaceae bacterium MAG52_C11]|nr:relaxase domain-containing protein [Candidatus Gaiellasilicea maunaloa]
MLTVAKLTPGQESYYERSVAAGLDDYYAGRGESPGIWFGRGAPELGLEGVVEDGQLGALIRGVHPVTEKQLRQHPKRRTITVERIDPETGERRTEEKKLSPVAGFDIAFACPKSVSLLHALGDEQTRRTVSEAHAAAWQAALAYLEDEACVLRRGKNGVTRERGSGFVAAAYQHRTSRAQDPHLHTHVLVANMAESPSDGEWRALDGEPILKTYRLAAGYLYQAQLRAELARSLGVEWETPVKGMAEMRGVPREVLLEFSQRRAQIVEHMSEHNSSGYRAAQIAAVETRERKEHVDLDRLREDWRARAAEHGLGVAELEAVIERQIPGLTREQLTQIAQRLLGPEGLTARRTAFSEPELVMAWAEAHIQGASTDRIRQVAARFEAIDGVRAVGEAPTPGRPARYSTAELIGIEQAALDLVARGADAGAPALTVEALDQGGPVGLSHDQAAMLRTVATSADRVVCVIGVAGAGKTTALRAATEAFQAAGFPVLGAAPSGVAAEKLADETGLRATTLHRLLAGDALPRGCVLVIDEAGMADTRVLAPILELVDRADGKAILVGDPHQLPAVGAGGLFAGIVERHGAVELTENRRQHDEQEREALAAVRRGLGRDYLAFAEGKERLVVSDDPLATKTRLLADWWTAARDDLPDNVMIALRRRDVAELNALARGLMETHGRLGRDRLQVGEREYAPGDRLVCLRNSDDLGVKNGTRGTVEAIDTERCALIVLTDRGDRVTLNRCYLEAGDVRHAYALTGHAAQGVTVDRAFVLGSGDARLQEWGYVAVSRARESTRLYVTETVHDRESHAADLDDRDPVTRFARALEESAIERLAVDQRPLPSGPRHDTRAAIDRHRPTREPGGRLRLIEHERLATLKVRELAERRLTEAEAKLVGAGPFLRRRRGDDLRADVASQRTAIRLADHKLSELENEAEILCRVESPESDRLGRPARQPAAMTRSHESNRASGLDLGL